MFAKSKEYSDIKDVISRTPRKNKKAADEDDEDDEDISDTSNVSPGKRRAEQEPTDVPAKREKKEVLD